MVVMRKRKQGEKVPRNTEKVTGVLARDRRLDTSVIRDFEEDTPNSEIKQSNM